MCAQKNSSNQFLAELANYIISHGEVGSEFYSALEWTVPLHQLRISISLIKPRDTRGTASFEVHPNQTDKMRKETLKNKLIKKQKFKSREKCKQLI